MNMKSKVKIKIGKCKLKGYKFLKLFSTKYLIKSYPEVWIQRAYSYIAGFPLYRQTVYD
uniref:Uncharacterized protein n=1 Tax=uncultured bacterium BLR12 TaxID=506514 RepID=C0ING6_9BACT|nr:hypothetical protein AKSOIL_0237 [uncultured bacterium BLR12]